MGSIKKSFSAINGKYIPPMETQTLFMKILKNKILLIIKI